MSYNKEYQKKYRELNKENLKKYSSNYHRIKKGKEPLYPVKEKKTIEEKFYSHVKVLSTTECWEWTGNKMTSGYGQFCLGRNKGKRKMVGAHRFSYELEYGPIPEGLYVLHKCDNVLCVNPYHLFVGTQADNMRDMISKQRNNPVRDTSSSLSKLTEEDVHKIRKDTRSCVKIALDYNVSDETIRSIRVNKTWKWLVEN